MWGVSRPRIECVHVFTSSCKKIICANVPVLYSLMYLYMGFRRGPPRIGARCVMPRMRTVLVAHFSTVCGCKKVLLASHRVRIPPPNIYIIKKLVIRAIWQYIYCWGVAHYFGRYYTFFTRVLIYNWAISYRNLYRMDTIDRDGHDRYWRIPTIFRHPPASDSLLCSSVASVSGYQLFA